MTDKELQENLNGIINTYFVRIVLERPDMAKNAKADILQLIHQRDGDRTAEVADVILGAMRSYRLRFPDANYDDAIGVVMGYKIPYTPTEEESR